MPSEMSANWSDYIKPIQRIRGSELDEALKRTDTVRKIPSCGMVPRPRLDPVVTDEATWFLLGKLSKFMHKEPLKCKWICGTRSWKNGERNRYISKKWRRCPDEPMQEFFGNEPWRIDSKSLRKVKWKHLWSNSIILMEQNDGAKR